LLPPYFKDIKSIKFYFDSIFDPAGPAYTALPRPFIAGFKGSYLLGKRRGRGKGKREGREKRIVKGNEREHKNAREENNS